VGLFHLGGHNAKQHERKSKMERSKDPNLWIFLFVPAHHSFFFGRSSPFLCLKLFPKQRGEEVLAE